MKMNKHFAQPGKNEANQWGVGTPKQRSVVEKREKEKRGGRGGQFISKPLRRKHEENLTAEDRKIQSIVWACEGRYGSFFTGGGPEAAPEKSSGKQ